jgi:cytoskeletal protein CcmA (bactofilin family)
MMANAISSRCVLFVLLCAAVSPLLAQETGEAVRITGEIAEDVYAAGGSVDVLATVDGDVVVAGGRVTVGERVSGDVMAAGGVVSVDASIGDDVRLAGGDIRLSGSVGGDAMAAGGNVTLAPDSNVTDRAWLSGGRVDVAGAVGRELKAAGGRIVLSGRVNGDAELTGRAVSILDSAIINGDLVYRSPQEADIADGAQTRGTVRYEPVEWPIGTFVATLAGVSILVLLSLIVTGIALFLLFPRFIANAVTTIRAEPWKCLGLGLAVFAATPVAISVLFFTVIGWLPAIVIGALYLILLLAGFLTGVFWVGDLGWRLRGRGEISKPGRLWSFVVALILIALLGLVPLLGALLLFALMLLGVGALKLGLYRVYVGQPES